MAGNGFGALPASMLADEGGGLSGRMVGGIVRG
jgi:hypothetical protein